MIILRLFLATLIAAPVLGFAKDTPPAEDVKKPIFAVFPGTLSGQTDYVEQENKYLPLVNYLKKETKADYVFLPVMHVDSAVRDLKRGYIKLFFGPPAFAIHAMGAGYDPISREDDFVNAAFLVRADSKVHSLQDIKGPARIGIPGRQSLMAMLGSHTLTKHAVPAAGLTVRVGSTQETITDELKHGYVDMVVVRDRFADKIMKKEANAYRIIAVSEKVPGFTLMASPAVGEQARKNIVTALSKLRKENPNDAALLKSIDAKGLVPALPQEYELLKTAAAGNIFEKMPENKQ